MGYLILVKHAMPDLDVEQSSRDWMLSEEGRRQCGPLSKVLRAYAPQVCVTSDEPKAQETGRRVATYLDLPWMTMADLHEHDRQGVPFVENRAVWQAMVKDFFDRPDDLVFGRETATQARARFARAIDGVLNACPDRTVAVVSHGTVISLFVAQKAQVDGFDLWRQLGLPSFVVLDVPSFELVDVVEKILE